MNSMEAIEVLDSLVEGIDQFLMGGSAALFDSGQKLMLHEAAARVIQVRKELDEFDLTEVEPVADEYEYDINDGLIGD